MPLTLAPPSLARSFTGLALVLACSAPLQAQPLAPGPQAEPVAPKAVAAGARPKYSRADIDMAFGFMDSNKDGKVSRQEGAGFRKVAKHFDAADTNKDQSLSRAEFESALNSGKKR